MLDALLEGGADARCLVRPSSRRDHLETTGAEVVEGDLCDRQSVDDAMDGCDQVFHVAADYRLFAREPRQMYASNVDGTRNVLRAASRHRVARVIYTSTVGTLGPMPDDSAANEESPVSLDHMVGHYKRSKFLGKLVAREWVEKGLPVVIVHPSAPIGERDHKPTATGKIILDFLNRRMPAYVDTGLNLVDVRDVAIGQVLAAQKGAIGQEYILGNRNMTLQEILDCLAEITGLSAPRVRLPHWIPQVVAAVDTALARILPREPWLPLEAAKLARHKMYFDPSKAVRELGIPQTPIEQPLRRAVEWYLENGYVSSSRR